MPGKNKDRIFGHIIEEHVSNAAFLWMLRDSAINQAHQTPSTLSKLESRINKHLKGCLAASPEVVWDYALEAAEVADGGESFVLGSLAFHHDDSRKIEIALELASTSRACLRGLVSALACLPDAVVFPRLKPWMYSEDGLWRYLSVAVCSLRRLDPRDHLKALLGDSIGDDLRLLSRTLRLVGELKRRDLRALLVQCQQHDDTDVKFWASWSALLLGDNSAQPIMHDYLRASGPHQHRAIDASLRTMDSDRAWSCINTLIQTPKQTGGAIIALATLGDPHGISWLLSRMEEREHSRLAKRSPDALLVY